MAEPVCRRCGHRHPSMWPASRCPKVPVTCETVALCEQLLAGAAEGAGPFSCSKCTPVSTKRAVSTSPVSTRTGDRHKPGYQRDLMRKRRAAARKAT